MADSSFDIVSKVDHMEVDNAFNQCDREISTRLILKILEQRLKNQVRSSILRQTQKRKLNLLLTSSRTNLLNVEYLLST